MRTSLPRALLFDWDNTLIDSWHAIHHALEVTFRALGQEPWTLEETRRRVRASARDSFPALFGARAGEATRIFYETYERDHIAELRALPGADHLVKALSGAGFYLAVVSNKQGYLLRREAKALGWDQNFQKLVGAGDAARDKPAHDPVHLALSAANLEADERVWFVGDTDVDMLCAVNSGVLPVLLRAEPPNAGEFGAIEIARHFPNCESLAKSLASA